MKKVALNVFKWTLRIFSKFQSYGKCIELILYKVQIKI